MAQLLYSLSLRLMEFMAWMVSFYNPKAKAFIRGHRAALSDLEIMFKDVKEDLLWVHASSVGEYEQGRPVVEKFKDKYPHYQVLVTFFSPSGYEAVQPDELINFTAYLPFDSRKNARQFIEIVKPKLAFFIKYEFWHFYLDELSRNKIPVFSVSSIFRPSQSFFKRYGGFFRKMLGKIDHFFVQDEQSLHLLERLGRPATITGDTRLDRVLQIREANIEIEEVATFVGRCTAMVVGSLRKEDIELISGFISAHPELKFIVAPHEIIEEMMAPLENKFDCIRFSNFAKSTGEEQVLIIDNIGYLSKIYRYANYAYVGGGFSDGIHNILEPAVYEIPVFFGNRDYQRFKEAHDLIDIAAGFAVGNLQEMDRIFKEISSSEERMNKIRQSISSYLEFNKGAAAKIIRQLEPKIS